MLSSPARVAKFPDVYIWAYVGICSTICTYLHVVFENQITITGMVQTFNVVAIMIHI